VALAILCATLVAGGKPVAGGTSTSAFRLARFTNCIRLTDGLYTGSAQAYSVSYSGQRDTRIAFAIVVTTKGHLPDRVGAIFAARRPSWADRFGSTTIRGFGPVVPRSDTTVPAADKAALAKHVRAVERQCIAKALR
jgi:hypothetical protein